MITAPRRRVVEMIIYEPITLIASVGYAGIGPAVVVTTYYTAHGAYCGTGHPLTIFEVK